MLLIPLLAVNKNSSLKTISANAEFKENYGNNAIPQNSFFYVLDEDSGNILKIPEKEMIYAAVATEMPAAYEIEALKAQAVASNTYFCHLRKNKPETQKYDFKINPTKNLNFTNKEQMKKNWGDRFDEYYEKIKNAVDEVFEKQIKYNGEPIFAAYHAISSGITEKSSDIFGGNIPYLTNVASEGDKSAKGYETKIEVAEEDFKRIICSNGNNCNFEAAPETWIGNCERTSAGGIKKIIIGLKEFKGTDIRNFFNLRSSNFKINYISENKKFFITTFGYGHGVGMSQFGANDMAKKGKNYKEILAWYYPGTELI